MHICNAELALSILIATPLLGWASHFFTNKSFTFADQHSFFHLEPDWPLQEIRQLTFKFRTDRPHGLLLYHGIRNPPENFTPYELYLMLENGCMKIIHVFFQDGRTETFFIGKGLNRNKWHHVRLKIDPGIGELSASVDLIEIKVNLQSLAKHPYYELQNRSVQSFLYFGGMDPQNPVWNQQYNYMQFIGCVGNVDFSHSNEPLVAQKILKHNQLRVGCVDRCSPYNICQQGSHCVNHFTHYGCDCFGTSHEGKICADSSVTTITIRGNSYLVYRIYDWRDRIHSEANRLSFTFKTSFPEAVLFYGSGQHPHKNYVAVNIIGGILFFEINFGEGPFHLKLGHALHNEVWHNFTMIHHGSLVTVNLDKEFHKLHIAGLQHHLHFDPEVYIGGVTRTVKELNTTKKFVGCLREVYFNDQNLLSTLRHSRDGSVRHHGIFPVEFGCSVVDVIPMTFSSLGGYLVFGQNTTSFLNTLNIRVDFKTHQSDTVIVSGKTQDKANSGAVWELMIRKGTAYMTVKGIANTQDFLLAYGADLYDGQWHQVSILVNQREAHLKIDYHSAVKGSFTSDILFFDEIYIGASIQNVTKVFVGCLRDLFVNEELLDPRALLHAKHLRGKVSMDNCQLVNPCNNPRVCEHGGRCYVQNSRTQCDCTGTGYTGETCHFAMYKRTCEELYLLGYRQSGNYKIDIDRNGPMPPAHVFCNMDPGGGSIATRVVNNLPNEMVVRKKGLKGFYMNIEYKNFTSQMLHSLIDQSKHCSQHFKYDCYKAPLGLYTYTWMHSAFSGKQVTHVGNSEPGRCPCSELKSCGNSSLRCKCDNTDGQWLVDEGIFTNPDDLAIDKIFILQPSKLTDESDGRLTLGPLECVETDTQQYVITFKTRHSYLEVPGWRNGDMAFSFRTSNDRAVLLYQAAAQTDLRYFRVLLTADNELTFEFTVSGVPRSVKVQSHRKLNSGEWQQVWVDHDTHHMRFTINLDSVMIELREEEVGPFEGPMFLGAVPTYFSSNSPIKTGFIGCFRGLVINNAVVDVYQYLTRRAPDISTGCYKSCSSNPCQNGATCHEFWGSYECQCANLLAHSGRNCENNINKNAVTFLTESSYLHDAVEGNVSHPILTEDILASFRTYQESAQLLYAFDHLNNFVQLHFEKTKLIFTFNSNDEIVQGIVIYPKLSTGIPIQVKVDREPDKTILYANGVNTTIDHPIIFLTQYKQQPWTVGENFEKVSPSRSPFQTVPHSEIYLGGVEKPAMVTSLPGFIGCLQGLKIGDNLHDIQALTKNKSKVTGEIKTSCKMLCDLKPCHHTGQCIEDWRNNRTTCDCSATSYVGDACEQDFGGSFDGKSLVQYTFTLPSLSSLMSPAVISAQLSFSSDTAPNLKQALLIAKLANSSKLLMITLDADGTLVVQEYRESTKIECRVKNRNNSFLDGYRHWVVYKRKGGEASVMIDGKMFHPNVTAIANSSQPHVDSNIGRKSSLIMVGGTSGKKSLFNDYANFKGCISNVHLEFDTLQMKPLKTAFGYEEGVRVVDTVRTEGKIEEGGCADFGTNDLFTSTPPQLPPELIDSKWEASTPIMIPYEGLSGHPEAELLMSISANAARVGVVMAVLLIIILLALMLYFWQTQRNHKRMQFQKEMAFFQGKRSNNSVKVVSFNDTRGFDESEVMPLHHTPELADLRTQSYITKPDKHHQEPEYSPNYRRMEEEDDDVEMMPIRSTPSQELEWDMGDMPELRPEEPTEVDGLEDDDLSNLPNQIRRAKVPMASTSEVTLHRLSETFA